MSDFLDIDTAAVDNALQEVLETRSYAADYTDLPDITVPEDDKPGDTPADL